MNSRPKWSPNGEWISFTSTRPLPKPNPDLSRSQLWLMNPFGGEPWPVTEFARGIQNYEWIDDNTIIFSAQEDPAFYEQELKRKKDTTRVVDDVDHEPPVRLFKLTVKDKKVTRLTDNTDFIQSWAVTPDGKRAMTVHEQYLSFEWDQKILPKIFLYDLVKGERKEILAGQRIFPYDIRAARDGSGFYFVAPYSSDPRFFTATVNLLYFYDLATGKDVKVDLGWENGVGGGFETTPDGFVTLLAAGARFLPARYVKTGSVWKRTDIEGEHVENLFGFAVSRDAKIHGLRTFDGEHADAVVSRRARGQQTDQPVEAHRPQSRIQGQGHRPDRDRPLERRAGRRDRGHPLLSARLRGREKISPAHGAPRRPGRRRPRLLGRGLGLSPTSSSASAARSSSSRTTTAAPTTASSSSSPSAAASTTTIRSRTSRRAWTS